MTTRAPSAPLRGFKALLGPRGPNHLHGSAVVRLHRQTASPPVDTAAIRRLPGTRCRCTPHPLSNLLR